MRILRRQIIFAFLFSIVLCQNDIYRSVDEVQDEWTGYTSFQKRRWCPFVIFSLMKGI